MIAFLRVCFNVVGIVITAMYLAGIFNLADFVCVFKVRP